MNSKPLACLSDLKESIPYPAHLENGDEILLIQCGDEIFAIDSVCPHMGAPLQEGKVENKCLTCPWHGWEFKVETGKCITSPGENLKRYPLKIIEGRIYLA